MKISKTEIISMAQTFVAFFVIDVGHSMLTVSASEIANGEVLTWAFFVSILVAGGRSALKLTWKKFMPVSLGGVEK